MRYAVVKMLNYVKTQQMRYLLSNLDAQGGLSSPKLKYTVAEYMDVSMDQVTTFLY